MGNEDPELPALPGLNFARHFEAEEFLAIEPADDAQRRVDKVVIVVGKFGDPPVGFVATNRTGLQPGLVQRPNLDRPFRCSD
jgi:hypothetical protein